jgi:hypothetical protein
MRHLAFFALLALAVPYEGETVRSPADMTTYSPSPSDTSNPASLGDAEKEQEQRMKDRYVPPAPPPLPRYREREYPPAHEPEIPRR